MVVKSPQNMECYRRRWFLAIEEFSFSYKASVGRFYYKMLQKHGFRHIRHEGDPGFQIL